MNPTYREHLQGQLIIAALDVVVASVEGHAPNMVVACVRCAKLELALKALGIVEGLDPSPLQAKGTPV